MKNMSLENICAAVRGRYVGQDSEKTGCVTSVTTDSRSMEAGCLFVAIRGERDK